MQKHLIRVILSASASCRVTLKTVDISMHYYKATLQYDGTNDFGFQWQKDIPTIQNHFNESLRKLLTRKVTTKGAARTDTGVHAIEQIVKITAEEQIDCVPFLIKLNTMLPSQIRCLGIIACEGPFNPISGAESKEYRYLFTNILRFSSFDQSFIVNNPYSLDLALLKKCAQEIVGTHDFRNFCSAGSNVKTTVRNVSLCEITEVDPHMVLPESGPISIPHELRRCYQFKIEGSGFLKQMVRHLMSALWLVAGGKIPPEIFSSLLAGTENHKRIWKVASPRGLYLYRIKYS